MKKHTQPPRVAMVLVATTFLFTAAHAGLAAQLSLVATQSDLRAAAGDPDSSIVPSALSYNPVLGKLLVVGGGSNGAILEWDMSNGSSTLLVPSANWSSAAFAAAYVPRLGSYLIAAGGSDDVLLEVQPDDPNQTPSVYVQPALLASYPAGGLVVNQFYAYYKNQRTGLQQTVNRVNLTGSPITDEELITKAMFDAYGLAGPSQELAMDSAGDIYVAGRPLSTSNNAVRGFYRFSEADSALVPFLTFDEITAYTGQSSVRIYGNAFDRFDALYFFDIYSSSIIRRDRFGNLSTLVTSDEVRDFFGDPEMQVHVSYMIVVNDKLVCISGTVSGHVFAIDLPQAENDLSTIPGADYEPGGPTYTYELGRYEITNAQYCVFLNDAELTMQTDPNNPRCSHMWIYPLNGDVFMTDVTAYSPGNDWYDRTLYKTSDLPDSKIKYDITQAPGSRFYVLPGFDHHPVGTISWFGAVKYCNWLTVRNGYSADQICYTEGTSRSDWFPITASNWSSQGLLPAERLELVRNYRGYRLPMDGVNYDNGGPGLAHSWNIATNPYNEWYKAAAWDPNAPDTVRPGPGEDEEVQPDHWIYGFGSDVYEPADENTSLSVTIFQETTPVGWYNGVNTLLDGTVTHDTRNQYGLYDLAGNVSEWNTDTVLEYPWDSNYRAQRGGTYLSSVGWFTNTFRRTYSARYYAENWEGFRILRSAGYGDFDGDCAIDGTDYLFLSEALSGPEIMITPGNGWEACDGDGDEDVDVADYAATQILGGWTCPS